VPNHSPFNGRARIVPVLSSAFPKTRIASYNMIYTRVHTNSRGPASHDDGGDGIILYCQRTRYENERACKHLAESYFCNNDTITVTFLSANAGSVMETESNICIRIWCRTRTFVRRRMCRSIVRRTQPIVKGETLRPTISIEKWSRPQSHYGVSCE
jgi:hypothetical protein